MIDIANLAAAVAPIAGDQIVFIASPKQFTKLRLYRTSAFPWPLFCSAALADTTVMAIALNNLAVAGADTPPKISVSTRKRFCTSKTPSPLPIGTLGTPPTIAAPTRSLFQTDAIAMRLIAISHGVCDQLAVWRGLPESIGESSNRTCSSGISLKESHMDDDQEWTPAQLAWPTLVEMETRRDVASECAVMAVRLFALVGCWDLGRRNRKSVLNRRPRLDTPPARPVLIRHGQEQPILVEMPWGKGDWKKQTMARRLDAVTTDDLIMVARIARQMSHRSRFAIADSLRDVADILEVDPDNTMYQRTLARTRACASRRRR